MMNQSPDKLPVFPRLGSRRIQPLALPELRQAISTVQSADLRMTPFDTLLELLTPVFRGYSISVPKIKAGVMVYRGVRRAERPLHRKDVSYPPFESRPDVQRASTHEQPMFYCSETSAQTLS